MLKRPAVLVAIAATLLTACGSSDPTPSSGGQSQVDSTTKGDWSAVLAEAKGQTVNWYMYGGDEVLNGFINGYVADQLKKFDVTLNQVKITDTADAVNKVLAEKQAGKNDNGSVDAIWVNGENFSTGKQADLWFCGYDQDLPNAKYVNFEDGAVANDFGVPVEGCESVWQQADSALVYDSSKLTEADVASVDSLFAWAQKNKGQFTYPALPDFTGSMAVRTLFYDTAGGPDQFTGPLDEGTYTPAADKLWKRLNGVEPSLWRGGKTYPNSQDDIEKLYGSGEIAAFFSYGPGSVADKVSKGVYPDSTREAVLSVGNIANNSFLGIPYNASHKAAAQVLANVLLDPATQQTLFKTNGTYPAVDLDKLTSDQKAAFESVDLGPSVLPLAELTADTVPELDASYVSRIEKDWKANVLQK